VQSFNLDLEDYKRFLNFLRKYQCHMPFQPFRSARVRLTDAPPADYQLAAKG
jgi:hypothetical protein